MNQNFFTTLKLNLKLIVPKSCRCLCCKESTKDRIFTQGYHKLKQEIEISSILKNLRVVKAAIKLNFTETEWKRFKEENEVRKLYLINREHKDQYKAEQPDKKKTASQEQPDFNRRKSMITSSIFGKLMSNKEEKKQSPTNGETGAKGLGSIQLSAAITATT